MPLDIVNQTQGANQLDLVYVYDVPLRTNQVPLPAESAYLAFKNTNCTLLDRMIPTRRFAPYFQVNDQASTTAIMAKSPLISCSDVNNVMYGHSLLFVKTGNTASSYLVKILLSARI